MFKQLRKSVAGIRIPVILVIVVCTFSVRAEDRILVAVASNMNHAMTEIIQRFEEISGNRVVTSSGSSGNFTRQILQGAPYQLFLSASYSYVSKLKESSRLIIKSESIALGRIGILVPGSSSLYDKEDLNEVINALRFNEFRSLVIANPEFAPYGIAAQQALESLGIWVIDDSKLLVGENAAQAAQFCMSGGIDICLIPASFTRLPGIKNLGRFFLLPGNLHEPIQQYVVLLDNDSQDTFSFYNFLLTDESMQILLQHGYDPVPGHN